MYYAVDSKNEIVATGATMAECSQRAAAKTGYAGSPGSVVPYFITNHDWFGETCPMCAGGAEMKKLKLTDTELNLIYNLLKRNHCEGSFWGNQNQFYNRQDRIIEKVEKVLLEKP